MNALENDEAEVGLTDKDEFLRLRLLKVESKQTKTDASTRDKFICVGLVKTITGVIHV